MVNATFARAPRPRRPRRRREQGGRHQRLYQVREFIAGYAIAVVANVTCLLMFPPLILLVYPGSGIALSRYIGRRIVWWSFLANVENVSSTKLHLILTWPVAVPVFIVKVSIAKFL